MQLASNKPTQPGFYWMKPSRYRAVVVEVVDFEDGRGLLVRGEVCEPITDGTLWSERLLEPDVNPVALINEGLMCPPPSERRAPVQGDRGIKDGEPGRHAGTIAWWEHEKAWEAYDRKYGGQSAERIAARAGFGYVELTKFLGGPPVTWNVRT